MKETKRGNDREQLFKLIFCDFAMFLAQRKKQRNNIHRPLTTQSIHRSEFFAGHSAVDWPSDRCLHFHVCLPKEPCCPIGRVPLKSFALQLSALMSYSVSNTWDMF